ncbi:MAG: ribonucleoside triphosphate reductase [bacterium]
MRNYFNKIDEYLDKSDWEVNENSNAHYSYGALKKHVSDLVMEDYWLGRIYDKKVANAHINGDFHIHDLGDLTLYCCGYSMRDIIEKGIRGISNLSKADPAKHFDSLLAQMANIITVYQNEIAGAVAFSSFDTYAAPFVKEDNLSYEQVYQEMQKFIWAINSNSRMGSEPAFTNLTFDITPSRDIIDQKVWFNGTRLDYTYRECQQEMDLINRAFYQIMLNGDANDAPHSYPIPTYNIHERFDWDNPNNEMLWEMAGKYGIPYFANFLNSEMNPEDVRSMCCRIQLDKRELRRRGGGLFGADEHTGSIGVVTMNLPRYAFIAKNEEQFFQILENKMEVAKNSLEQKRKFITERVLKTGLTPAFIEYVGKLDNHFSTIGFVGQNEMCLNLFNESIKSDKGHNFSVEVLKFMREKVADFQEETGNLYNLEASPAESTAYRLALKDREEFGDLIATQIGANNEPYYTNSCHLAVKDIESITQLYEHQNDLQKLPTGGTVIHNYYNQPISGEKIKKITKTICENYEVPYISHSPLYSVCPIHGQLQGFYNKCPECGTVVESYQRITGYIRPISKFNNGKKAEFFDRSQLKI